MSRTDRGSSGEDCWMLETRSHNIGPPYGAVEVSCEFWASPSAKEVKAVEVDIVIEMDGRWSTPQPL